MPSWNDPTIIVRKTVATSVITDYNYRLQAGKM